MAQILTIHSFRGGTGKSSLVANVAGVLAAKGRRVAVVDADLQSPGIHILFGLPGAEITRTLNDYLWGGCDVADVVYDVTERAGAGLPGRLFLVPASIRPADIARILRQGYDVQLLTRGVRQLIDDRALDVLLIDTHPGLNEETLLSMVIADNLAIVMRPDAQDYEGTAATLEVAHELEVPNLALIVNNIPDRMPAAEVRAQVQASLGCPVLATLPHSDDVMGLASGGIFALRYPDHPAAASLRDLTAALTFALPAASPGLPATALGQVSAG